MSEDRLEYDVIIVGGGPAGSTAGYLLSKFGFKVLTIDKDNFPRRKLCGGLITLKTLKLLNRIFDETEASLGQKDILNFRSDHYEIFYKNKLLVKNSSHIPFYFVDRQIYDCFLLERAKEVGAEIMEGEKVKTISLPINEVATSKGRKFKAKFIVGADGANSIIRKKLFLKSKNNAYKWQHNLGTAFEIFIDRTDIREVVDHPTIVFGFVNCGYAWIFPNKDKLLVGLGGLNRANKGNFLDSFQNFLSVLNLDRGRISKVAGHPVPYGDFLLRPVLNNVVLVGDAAGFVDPVIGEGIFYAQRSAELASWAIYKSMCNNENLETSYLQLLQKYVYPELVNAKKVRRLIFSGFNNKLHYYPMKILVNILDKKLIELVHGVRTYKGLKKRGEVYESL